MLGPVVDMPKLTVDCAQANDQAGQAPKDANSSELAATGPVMKLIAGPCLMENTEHPLRMAESLARITCDLPVEFYFKTSWKKANRTSIHSPTQMVAIDKAARVFEVISRDFDIACCTDIHEPREARHFGGVACLQIPALLSRQTDLIRAAAEETLFVNIKKGQFTSPEDMRYAVEKARVSEDAIVWVTERGTTFGYGNLVVDMRSIPIMKMTSGADASLFDATHSVQLPSAGDAGTSGGLRECIEPLARAAIASGADGLFCEVHDDPQNALSDGPCQIPLHHFSDFLKRMLELYEWTRERPLSDLSVLSPTTAK